MKPRVLVVAHNHPDFHPGGTEIFAHDLFAAYRRAGATALFLAATNAIHRQAHPGTSFLAVNGAPDELVLWSGHFDRFMMSQVDLHGVVPDLVQLLRDFRPDVVHLHHLLLVGAELPAVIRRVLPEARIVMTLHDYYPICAHDGLMVRRSDGTRCDAASPAACHGCFPDIPASRFLLRELGLKANLAAVDRFVAPSAFLRDRYIAWGIAPDQIEVIRNAIAPGPVAGHRSALDGRRNVFGYFGNFNPWKGVLTLLDAAAILAEGGTEFELRIHGAAPFQSAEFNAALEARFGAAGRHVVRLGAYRREEIGELMAAVDWVVVPSVWWENAPLVILEAQHHCRPVIASGIGGMAELVADGVDGIHVRPGDPAQLARTMRRLANDPTRLWQRLVDGISPPPGIDAAAAAHFALFERLAEHGRVAA